MYENLDMKGNYMFVCFSLTLLSTLIGYGLALLTWMYFVLLFFSFRETLRKADVRIAAYWSILSWLTCGSFYNLLFELELVESIELWHLKIVAVIAMLATAGGVWYSQQSPREEID